MTKQRHCFVAQVGDAIEALASALDPERKPPFKGDILDLLEWAEKDVLEMRQQVTLLREALEGLVAWANDLRRSDPVEDLRKAREALAATKEN